MIRTPVMCIRRLALPVFVAVVVALALGACGYQPPMPSEDGGTVERVRAPAPDQPPAGLQVFPLRNAAVTELTEAAHQAERDGDLDRAAMLLERALRIESRDPEVLQHMAEIKLGQADWSQAESYASRSFDVGPRVGELCQRNWRTMALARERQARHDDAHQARERLQACRVEPPPRF